MTPARRQRRRVRRRFPETTSCTLRARCGVERHREAHRARGRGRGYVQVEVNLGAGSRSEIHLPESPAASALRRWEIRSDSSSGRREIQRLSGGIILDPEGAEARLLGSGSICGLNVFANRFLRECILEIDLCQMRILITAYEHKTLATNLPYSCGERLWDELSRPFANLSIPKRRGYLCE